MAASLSALLTGRRFIPQKHYFSARGTHFCPRLSKTQDLVRLRGLGKLLNIIHLVGCRTVDLPSCSVALNEVIIKIN
jgi:hypothetical protein